MYINVKKNERYMVEQRISQFKVCIKGIGKHEMFQELNYILFYPL